jgi:segregation and condensation protein B
VTETHVLPELKQIIGAMLFAAKGSVSPGDIRRCLKLVAEERGGPYKDFAEVTEKEVVAAMEALREQLREAHAGVHINEVASGYRMENDADCGPWLRQLLQKGRANRLSRPALETLAVIAYRQPATRGEIEAVRGVAVDQILRNLMELQLIRITGRSELPGRPWQFGTTQKFLEYFGLKDVKELPGVEELRRMEAEQEARKSATKVEEPVMAPAEEETAKAEALEAAKPAPEAEDEDDDENEDGEDEGDTDGDEAEPDEDADDGDEDEYDDDEFEDDEEDEDDDGDDEDEEEGDDEEESGEKER